MRRLYFVFLVLGLMVDNVSGVNVYQEGKGVYLKDLHFSIGSTSSQDSIVKWGGVFSMRLNDHLDAGFMLDYSRYNRREVQEWQEYYYDSYGFQGEGVTFGPVIGYTKSLGYKGFGLRSTLSLRFTLSNVVIGGDTGKLALAGFGSDFTINFFKKFRLGKSLSIYPGLGLFLSANRTTGRNYDIYQKNHHYGNLSADFIYGERRTHNAYGLMVELPISLKIVKNKYLIIKSSSFINFESRDLGVLYNANLSFNFCFQP